jgi:uncharacterized protein YbbC (DUF1343 family)
MTFTSILFFLLLSFSSCAQQQTPAVVNENDTSEYYTKYKTDIVLGAERYDAYSSFLQGKKVAVVGNHTTVVGGVHLVDFLISKNIHVVKVFAPEHGFRGTADAGELVASGKDVKTGLPIISLYGKNKKPSKEQLQDVDVLIFDIQDVGARFYTYISTMHYVMEAAAELGKKVIVLDRPNPNGHYVDGPVLDRKHKSFIGMHPVPVVHGMTVAEYATMVNEEGWLANKVKCDLTVVTCENYAHNDFYELPIAPSPNLPNMAAIYLYPSLCLFEGTKVSVGRGTDLQFQIIGYPEYADTTFCFTPKPNLGAKNPDYNGIKCCGLNLHEFGDSYFRNIKALYLDWLTLMYQAYPNKVDFFRKDGFFTLLIGNEQVRKLIEQNKPIEEISSTWKKDVEQFKQLRKKYLLYEDFE